VPLPEVRRLPAGWIALALLGSAALGIGMQASPMLVVDVAVVAVVTVAVALRPYESLLAILALRATVVNSVFADVATLAGGAVALVVAAPRLPVRRVSIPLIALLLIALPGVPTAPSFDEGFVPAAYVPGLGVEYLDPPSTEFLQWLRLGSALVVLCLAAWTVRDRPRLELAVGATLAGAVYPIAIGLQQIATGDYQERAGFDAIRGPFYQSNYYAFYLVVALTVAYAATTELRALWQRTAAAIVLGLGTVCLVFTYTRAAWIGFAAVLLIAGLLQYRRVLVVAAIVLLALAIGSPAQTDRVGNRIDSIANPASSGDDSWSWRKGEWRRMFPHGMDNALTGTGFGSYSRMTVEEFGTRDPKYSTAITPGRQGFAAHNDYLKTFVENGFPGLVLWLLVLTGIATTMWRARRNARLRGYATAGFALAIALLGMSFSDNIQAYTAVMIYALGFAGAVYGAATAAGAARRPGGDATGTRAAPDPA
jgi:putative inorganic carbon (HCO3(-)) transporter